jgi:hypothetical protein
MITGGGVKRSWLTVRQQRPLFKFR